MTPSEPPVHTLIWDWNGTLLDDRELCLGITNRMLGSRGRPPLSAEAYQGVFGFPVSDYYRAVGLAADDGEFEAASVEFVRAYYDLADTLKLHPGVRECLFELGAAGLRQVLLSATPQRFLQPAIVGFGLTEAFDEILGIDTIHAPGKLERAVQWRELASAEGRPVDPSTCLLIGDTVHDWEVSREIGCACWLVDYGHTSRARLQSLGCPVYSHFGELRQALTARGFERSDR